MTHGLGIIYEPTTLASSCACMAFPNPQAAPHHTIADAHDTPTSTALATGSITVCGLMNAELLFATSSARMHERTPIAHSTPPVAPPSDVGSAFKSRCASHHGSTSRVAHGTATALRLTRERPTSNDRSARAPEHFT